MFKLTVCKLVCMNKLMQIQGCWWEAEHVHKSRKPWFLSIKFPITTLLSNTMIFVGTILKLWEHNQKVSFFYYCIVSGPCSFTVPPYSMRYLQHSWLTDTNAHNHLVHWKFVILQERMLQNNVHKCVSICTLGCWFFYSLLAVWRCFPPNVSFLKLVTMKTIWINFKSNYYIW